LSFQCGGSITVTNFAAASVDDVIVNPGGLVISSDGTFQLAPGDYTAVGRVNGQAVTDATAFTIEACPAATQVVTPPTGPLPPTDTVTTTSSDGFLATLGILAVVVASAYVLARRRFAA
jgi:hypothetical protein